MSNHPGGPPDGTQTFTFEDRWDVEPCAVTPCTEGKWFGITAAPNQDPGMNIHAEPP